MAYLGRQPNTGVRSRYIFTATASQTTFTGSDDDGKTLKYEDAAYLDVFLNGVLLKPVTDYTATSKTSVVLTSGAAVSDIVEIVAYDIANIADTVSKANGGTFDAGVTVNGDLTVDTNTLYVDAANNRVGVGTASPSNKITIDGAGDETTPNSVITINSTLTTSGATRLLGVRESTTQVAHIAYSHSNNNLEILSQESNGGITFFTGGLNERVGIDSSGRITTSSQPSFEAYRTSGNVTTSNSTVVFNNTRHNVGNHYSTSTGNFTAPINGTYLFTTQAFTNAGSSGVVDIQVNGYSRVRMEADTNVSYRSMFASGVFSLSANDVVRIWCIAQPIHYNTSGAYSNFCGYLLG